MGSWAALGKLFTLLFAPPVISLESLRQVKLKENFTVKNITFGLFWVSVLCIATNHGVWSRLREAWLVEWYKFCGCAPSIICDRTRWVAGLAFIALFSGWAVRRLYSQRPGKYKRFRRVIDGTMFYLQSAYELKKIAQLVDIIPVLMKQLSMNYFLFRTRDDDGEIMVFELPEEKLEIKKYKSRFGVPKAIKIKQQQAIESAQAVAVGNPSHGSIRKVSGSVKNK